MNSFCLVVRTRLHHRGQKPEPTPEIRVKLCGCKSSPHVIKAKTHINEAVSIPIILWSSYGYIPLLSGPSPAVYKTVAAGIMDLKGGYCQLIDPP